MKQSLMPKYYVQAQSPVGLIESIGHSKDEETGEINVLFVDRKKAVALLKKEKALVPESKYRIVKETTTLDIGNWE